jgi:hypothetical protein
VEYDIMMHLNIDENSPVGQFILAQQRKTGLPTEDILAAALTVGMTGIQHSIRDQDAATPDKWQKAYRWFIKSRAAKEGKTETAIQAEISFSDFYTLLHTHHLGIDREYSFGYIADLLKANVFDLNHIFMEIGLSIHP